MGGSSGSESVGDCWKRSEVEISWGEGEMTAELDSRVVACRKPDWERFGVVVEPHLEVDRSDWGWRENTADRLSLKIGD